MFNIIETLQNYFARELLPDYLSSEVALHFNVNFVFIQRLYQGRLSPPKAICGIPPPRWPNAPPPIFDYNAP